MTPHLARTLTITALAVFAAATLAHADAIEGPPATCPPGAVGTASHAGSWCTPADCDPTTDCAQRMTNWASPTQPAPGQYTCQPHIGLCVQTSTISAGGRSRSMITKREALSSCHSSAECPNDAPCEFATRCAEAPTFHSALSPASKTFWQRAFSCDDAPAPAHNVGSLFFGLGGLGLAAVLARRRR